MYGGTTTYGTASYGGGTGHGTGTNYYAPYVARGPPSRAVFHLILDESILRPGEQVTLRGDLECLGSGGPGIPMAQSEDDAGIWETEVEMPFGMTETHFRGLFNFRYGIESADGSDAIEEGSTTRNANDMLRHFYHNCRTNYREPRLAQRYMTRDDVALSRFVRRELIQLQAGRITTKEFLARFKGISKTVAGVQRQDAEELFGQLLTESGDKLPLETFIAMLGAVGTFDLSSTERVWHAHKTNYGTASYGGGTGYGTGGYYKPKPVPAPQPWCKAVCRELVSSYGPLFARPLGLILTGCRRTSARWRAWTSSRNWGWRQKRGLSKG